MKSWEEWDGRQWVIRPHAGVVRLGLRVLRPLRPRHCGVDVGLWLTLGAPTLGRRMGRHYYEFELGANVACPVLGWLTEGFREGAYDGRGVGSDDNGWGIDGQRLCHAGKARILDWPYAWKHGDIIGCAIDLEAGLMSFSHNGTWVSAADTLFKAAGRYFYPAVSTGGEFTFRLREDAFRYKPPSGRYASLLELSTENCGDDNGRFDRWAVCDPSLAELLRLQRPVDAIAVGAGAHVFKSADDHNQFCSGLEQNEELANQRRQVSSLSEQLHVSKDKCASMVIEHKIEVDNLTHMVNRLQEECVLLKKRDNQLDFCSGTLGQAAHQKTDVVVNDLSHAQDERSRNVTLEKEVEVLNTQLAEHMSAHRHAQAESQAALEVANNRIVDLESELATLKEMHTEPPCLADETIALKEDCGKKQTLIVELELRLNMLTERNKSLEETLNGLIQTNMEAEQAFTEQIRDLTPLPGTNADMESSLKDQVVDLRQREREFEIEHGRLRKQVLAEQERALHLEEELRITREKGNHATSPIGTSEWISQKEQEALQAECEVLKARIRELECGPPTAPLETLEV